MCNHARRARRRHLPLKSQQVEGRRWRRRRPKNRTGTVLTRKKKNLYMGKGRQKSKEEALRGKLRNFFKDVRKIIRMGMLTVKYSWTRQKRRLFFSRHKFWKFREEMRHMKINLSKIYNLNSWKNVLYFFLRKFAQGFVVFCHFYEFKIREKVQNIPENVQPVPKKES